ncbi:unnamed protein product [Lota lota]
MGGNSPSQFAHEGDGEASGVSFVKGIRLSDRVVHRMKETPKVARPQPSDNKQQAPSHSEPEPVAPVPTAPYAEHVSTPPESPITPLFPTLPAQEPTPASTSPFAQPIKLTSPPPVKFHSPPPPVVHQEPKMETMTDPVALTMPLPSPVPEPEATSKPLPETETVLPTLVVPPQTETVLPTLVELITQSVPPPIETASPTLVEPIDQYIPPLQTETALPTLVEPIAQPVPPPQTEAALPTLVEPIAQPVPPPQTEAALPTLVEPIAQSVPPYTETAFSTLVEPKVLSAPVEPPPSTEAEVTTSSPPHPQTLQLSAILEDQQESPCTTPVAEPTLNVPPILLPAPVEIVTPPPKPSPPAEAILVATSIAPSVEDNITAVPVLSFESVGPPSPTVIEIGNSVVSQTAVSGPPTPADPPRLCHSMEVSLPTHGSAAAEPPMEPIDMDPPPLDAEPEVQGSTSIPVTEDQFPVFILRPLPVPDVSVDEEELRRKIKQELQERLGEEIHQKKQELQLQLQEVKARARAEARAAAQVQIQEQVKQTLEAERAGHVEQLRNALLTERMKCEDERLIAQVYWLELKAHKLDEKERALKEQDERFREHLTKLEEKRSQFYKVSAENFKKGKEETHGRFARYSITPACGDLQSRVMNCYRGNAGQTLTCSSIAAAYMRCVADAKQQNKLSTGG